MVLAILHVQSHFCEQNLHLLEGPSKHLGTQVESVTLKALLAAEKVECADFFPLFLRWPSTQRQLELTLVDRAREPTLLHPLAILTLVSNKECTTGLDGGLGEHFVPDDKTTVLGNIGILIPEDADREVRVFQPAPGF